MIWSDIFPPLFLLLMGLFLSTPLHLTDLCNVAGMRSAAQGVEIWLTEGPTDEEDCFIHQSHDITGMELLQRDYGL